MPGAMTLNPDDLARAWYRLRLLAIGHAAGWYEYAGGDLSEGRHVLRLPNGQWRELRRYEEVGWVRGVADAMHDGHTAEVWANIPIPELWTIQETADALGVTEAQINYRFVNDWRPSTFGTGRKRASVDRWLYPVYVLSGNLRVQHTIAAQAKASLGDTAAEAEWQRLRGLLPPTTTIPEVTDYPGPVPSPDPLPFGNDRPMARRAEALTIATNEGWLDFVHGDPQHGRWTVDVPTGNDHVHRRTLQDADMDVLAYVLGHADVHGHPELVAYREGLG
jgi:hypothetical protein